MTEASDAGMAGELHNVMDDAEKLVDATAAETDERTCTARAKLEETLAKAKVKYGALKDDLRGRVTDADKLIREKPYYAIGGSFVIGLLLGWLMSRK